MRVAPLQCLHMFKMDRVGETDMRSLQHQERSTADALAIDFQRTCSVGDTNCSPGLNQPGEPQASSDGDDSSCPRKQLDGSLPSVGAAFGPWSHAVNAAALGNTAPLKSDLQSWLRYAGVSWNVISPRVIPRVRYLNPMRWWTPRKFEAYLLEQEKSPDAELRDLCRMVRNRMRPRNELDGPNQVYSWDAGWVPIAGRPVDSNSAPTLPHGHSDPPSFDDEA